VKFPLASCWRSAQLQTGPRRWKWRSGCVIALADHDEGQARTAQSPRSRKSRKLAAARSVSCTLISPRSKIAFNSVKGGRPSQAGQPLARQDFFLADRCGKIGDCHSSQGMCEPLIRASTSKCARLTGLRSTVQVDTSAIVTRPFA